MIGQQVSHYQIVEKIGEGGMGQVYLAEDVKLKRRVALKFLPEDLTRDETRKKRFIQEARAAAAIEHPHIGTVHDIDEFDGRTFIVMEYVRGESLRRATSEHKLSTKKSLDLAIQIADGLGKAHERGVVHRDLKPDNIVLTEDGYAKVIDFGLAKLIEPLTATGVGDSSVETETRLETREGLILGTVAYMSPEQARGAEVDAKSDIFSFGVVLYEMLTGKSPFRRASIADSLSAVLKEEPPTLELEDGETSTALQRILRKLLAKDPTARYQNIKDAAIDLRELRDTVASGESTGTTTALQKRPSRVWPTTLALLATVTALAIYFGRRQPPTPPGIGAAGRPAIAVMTFEDHSGAEEIRWLSQGLPSMLTTGLAQTPGLDVISSQRIHEILSDIGEESLEAIDKGVMADVARRAGAGAVVVGSIFKAGSEIRLDVQVEDISSGRVLSAESVRGSDVFPLVDELTGRVRTSLQLSDRPAGRPIADVTTPSLEAYHHYSEGLQASRNLRYLDARSHFEKAVAIDPSFALAYSELSYATRSLGLRELSQEYAQRVIENLERLPERHRLLAEARYSQTYEGNVDKAIHLLEMLVDLYPDAEDAYIRLDINYRLLGQSERGFAFIERGAKALPTSGPIQNAYGYSLMQKGRYDEAIRAFETYARLEPNEPNPLDSLGEAYLITGQLDQARDTYSRALTLDPNFIASYGGRIYAYALEGRYDEAFEEEDKMRRLIEHEGLPISQMRLMQAFGRSRLGRYREAERYIEEGKQAAERHRQLTLQIAFELHSAALALETHQPEKVDERLDRVRELSSQLPSGIGRRYFEGMTHLFYGVADLRSGNLRGAREHLAAQEEVYDPRDTTQKWAFHVLEAEIALAEDDLAAAEAAVSRGLPKVKMYFSNSNPPRSAFSNNLLFRDITARIKKARGDLTGAIEIYRQLNTPGAENKWTAVFEPRYVLETARLLHEAGDRDAARAEYRRFLEYWQDADPELPELQEAKEYLGR